MAAKNDLSHEVLGPFKQAGLRRRARGVPPRILHTATKSFEKTLGQWIDSFRAPQEPAAAPCIPRRGFASVKDASGKRHLLGPW